MVDSLPTASVTGRQGWEWNRWQADVRSRASPPRSRPAEYRPTERPASRPRDPPPRADCRDTAAVPRDRDDRRLQAVIDRYESLLDDRDRRLAEATAPDPAPAPAVAAVQFLRRLVAGR